MKIVIIVLIGAVVQAIIESFLSVKFGHWYDRLIFQVMAGIYGMSIWGALSK